MAGVAIATVDSPAALLHNPAQLDRIERFAITASATSLLVDLRAPFAGLGSEVDSGLIYAPLPFLGVVGRVHPRLALGVGAYVITGFGGGFPTVSCFSYGDASACGDPSRTDATTLETPIEQSVTLFVGELAVPLQVTVVPEVLSVGVTFRLPYGRQAVSAVQQEPLTGSWAPAEQDLDGFGVPGVLIGVTYRPIPELALAAVYRSKVWVNMSGITEVPFGSGDPIAIATTTRWYVPHMMRFGLALTTWRERLTLSSELRIQLHRTANETQVFDLQPDGVLAALVPDTVAQFRWKNVYIGSLGGGRSRAWRSASAARSRAARRTAAR